MIGNQGAGIGESQLLMCILLHSNPGGESGVWAMHQDSMAYLIGSHPGCMQVYLLPDGRGVAELLPCSVETNRLQEPLVRAFQLHRQEGEALVVPGPYE
jgi:hypothetical protein